MAIPILGDIINGVKDLVGEVIVDKDKKKELEFKLQELLDKSDERFHQELMGQIEVNKVEAAHPSIFVAGWRPAIGWVGATSIAYTFLVAPFTNQIAKWLGYAGEMVVLDTASLMVLITGMLGIGGMRSFEKVRGVETSEVRKK